MSKPLPTTETERTEEARALVRMIDDKDYVKLTSWELSTVLDVLAGKAATKFRLNEIREIVHRIQK